MTDVKREIIVRFTAGVSEPEARATVEQAGGVTRRRMRWDPQDEVLLLVRATELIEQELRRHPRIAHVELNSDDYTPMSR